MCLFPVPIRTRPKQGYAQRLTVSCGKCLECQKQRSVEWAFRIMDECRFHDNNCFITLTYNNEHLPSGGSVCRREMQLFIKSLRRRLSCKIRFFLCGEYGKKFSRPHYHVICFGWFPDDAIFFQHKDGVDLYRSSLLESVWTKGFSTVGRVSYDSALYCAKYMNKFQYDMRHYAFKHINPPFVQMSNRPGIGFKAVYDCNLATDRIYYNGKSCKIPRYYLKVMERDGIYLDEFKERRKLTGEMYSRSINLNAKIKFVYDKFLGVRLTDKDILFMRRARRFVPKDDFVIEPYPFRILSPQRRVFVSIQLKIDDLV